MELTDSEFDTILKDTTKHIRDDIMWEEDEDRSRAWCFRANVESVGEWPLFVQGYYNSGLMKLTYALILRTTGRIYALDLGRSHGNPGRERVGRKHKHRWSERHRDKMAYVPEDVKASASDPVEVWREFCAEARIRHEGRMEAPAERQEDRF